MRKISQAVHPQLHDITQDETMMGHRTISQ